MHLQDVIKQPLSVSFLFWLGQNNEDTEKNVKFQQMFYDIGGSPTITTPMIVLFNEWICLLYGKKTCTNIDDARLDNFF